MPQPIGATVTFIVNASKGVDTSTTVRLSVAVAIAKADALIDQGWEVSIIGPDGKRYGPSEFDKLLTLDSALRSPA
jgi:hypothetical protein